MNTQQTHLAAFFSSYNFTRYKYDPANSPTDEFERLCTARQWGSVKRDENHAKFLLVAPQEARKLLVANFFRKYEFVMFTYDPSADPVAEFDRLQAARKWGERNLEKVRKEFLQALEDTVEEPAEPAAGGRIILERLPIVEFLKRQEVPGYDYRYGRPEVEFKRLVQAKRRIWEAEERRVGGVIWEARMGGAVTSEDIWEMWRDSDTFEELHEEYYEAVEEQFNLMLDEIAGETGLLRHEVMVELYCVGKAPVSKGRAKEALRSVHVNIFDFLDLVGETINTATEHERENLIRLLSPGARALNFPSDAVLSIYSMCMGRIFPRHRARRGGTLILLLRLINPYFGRSGDVFDSFRDEAGEEFDRAKKKGPDAIRNLLLSRQWVSLRGVRELPNLYPGGPLRPRGREGPPPSYGW